jgi:hypothetical protein
MSTEPDNYGPPPDSTAHQAVNLPGLFLIIVGILNLALAVFQVFQAIQVLNTTPEEVQAQIKKIREVGPMMENAFPGITARMIEMMEDEQGRRLNGIVTAIWAGVALLIGFLGTLGGVRMRALRSYGLALTGALLTAIPCLSCSGCCGLGEVVGIWAVVVLANTEVRQAFGSAATGPVNPV